MLNDLRQTQKVNHHVFLVMCGSFKKGWSELGKHKGEGDRDMLGNESQSTVRWKE
jgi:hypothetical protein